MTPPIWAAAGALAFVLGCAGLASVCWRRARRFGGGEGNDPPAYARLDEQHQRADGLAGCACRDVPRLASVASMALLAANAALFIAAALDVTLEQNPPTGPFLTTFRRMPTASAEG